MRNQVSHYHDKWYSEAVALADKIQVKEEMPRTSRLQRHRDNPPASSASDYFKRALTIPLLDHLNADLAARFDNNNLVVYYGLSIVPSKMISILNGSETEKLKVQFIRIFYTNKKNI